MSRKGHKDFRLPHHPQTAGSIEVPLWLVGDMFRNTVVDPRTGCWNYTPPNMRNPENRDYPNRSFRTDDGEKHIIRLNRLALLCSTDAPAPPGLDALHSCGNRRCVRPHHLRWGTDRDNSEDFWQAKRLRQQLHQMAEKGQPIRVSVTRSAPVCVAA